MAACFTIIGWERRAFSIGEHYYIQICTASDAGGNLAVVYRTAYECGLDESKTPPRPAHQVALRSKDERNPHGLGLPVFAPVETMAESTFSWTQPAAKDKEQWESAQVNHTFCSLFWHNPQSYCPGREDPRPSIAEESGGKGCLYDLVKTGAGQFELTLVHLGNQDTPEVQDLLTKQNWWCAHP
ncbi:unnamed protein product [Polarella glacialis]|uniref:Uncharacterized protein n=1 Tax=Polarella glacialis TaxID=89957 RepID=A0A813DB77_POLGL|nr:unnamed protein product [Polarella glacialis]